MYRKKIFFLSLIFFCFLLSLFYKVQFANRKEISQDEILDTFRPVNLVLFFEKQKKLSDVFLSLDSFLMDVISIAAVTFWILKPDCYTIVGVGLFYMVRTLALNLSKFPLPKIFFFQFTYPSLFVHDGRQNDFYYSGHVGVLVCLMQMMWYRQYKKSIMFVALFCFFTALCLNISGAHYINDYIFGIIAAFCCFQICYKLRYETGLYLLRVYVKIFGFFEQNNFQEEQETKNKKLSDK